MLKGLWQRLRGGDGDAPVAVGGREEYNGFEIVAMPRKDGSAWRVAGEIRRPGAGDAQPHVFVRADSYGEYEAAVSVSLAKGRRLIEENGESLFDPPATG